jgi:hypothetical protein
MQFNTQYKPTNTVKNKDKLKEIPLLYDVVFHITHIDNLETILKNGLLSHNNPYKKTDISNQDVNSRRNKIEPIYKNNLHNYVPFYFNCRNSMLYKTQKEFGENIIILIFERDIMLKNNVLFTNKGAATNDVKFTNDIKDLLDNDFINWANVKARSWDLDKNLKQTMMAEMLLLGEIDANEIDVILCQNDSIKDIVTNYLTANSNKADVFTCGKVGLCNEIFFKKLIK